MKKRYSILLLLLTTILLSSVVFAQDSNDTIEQASVTNDNTHVIAKESPQIENTLKSSNSPKYDNNNKKQTDDTELDDETEGMGCSTVIVQGANNDSALSFRRDATNKLTVYVKHNNTIIKQHKENSYFFHVLISKDGWMVGNGGQDNAAVNHQIESNALTMINKNAITTSNMNKIYNLESKLSLGHFVIKAPNGQYSLVIKNSGKSFKTSGTLKANQYLIVPNSARCYKKSSVSDISTEAKMITQCRLLAAKDTFGVNRREIITYYYKNNYYNSTVKISATNDNGKYVGRKTASKIDNIQTNSKYFASGNIPVLDNAVHLDTVTYKLRDQPPKPKGKLSTRIILTNTTGTIGEKTTYYAYVKDSEGKNVTGGNFVFKLNDVTLKNSLGNVMKTTVVNGMAKMTIDATSRFNHAKITATYSGSNQYNSSRSTTNAYTNFTPRKAQLTLNITDKEPEQYDTIQFKVKINDLTSNKTKTALYNQKAFVIFKINGVTLKDDKGQTIKVYVDKNATATYNYTIAQGMAGYKDGKIRYYNVTARYSSPDYTVEEIINDSFTVKRSSISIDTPTCVLDTDNSKLIIKGNIRDYKNNTVVGYTKFGIKINGKTFNINNSNVVKVYNGVIDLEISLGKLSKNVNEIMLVAGESSSYTSCRKTLKVSKDSSELIEVDSNI